MMHAIPDDQVQRNKDNAVRVMAMVTNADLSEVTNLLNANLFSQAIEALDKIDFEDITGMCPPPKAIIRAEIKNANMYSQKGTTNDKP